MSLFDKLKQLQEDNVRLTKENKKLKAELENIKKRVKEHTTYSVKAEFIKKFGE